MAFWKKKKKRQTTAKKKTHAASPKAISAKNEAGSGMETYDFNAILQTAGQECWFGSFPKAGAETQNKSQEKRR